MVRLSPSQLLSITIFTGRKVKTANDVLNRKVPAAGTPAAAPPRYDFYTRKSEKLTVASQSAGISAADIPAALYGTSVFDPAATLVLRFLRTEKRKRLRMYSIEKSLLLARLLLLTL